MTDDGTAGMTVNEAEAFYLRQGRSRETRMEIPEAEQRQIPEAFRTGFPGQGNLLSGPPPLVRQGLSAIHDEPTATEQIRYTLRLWMGTLQLLKDDEYVELRLCNFYDFETRKVKLWIVGRLPQIAARKVSCPHCGKPVFVEGHA